VLAVVIAFGGGYWLWLRSARARLDAALAKLRAEGEPVTAEEMTRPAVRTGDNAVFELRPAAMLIDARSADWKAYQNASYDEPLSDVARAAIAKVLEPQASRRALARVRAARSRPGADWQIQMRSPLISMLLPDLEAQRHVTELCRAAGLDAQLRKDYGAVVESARDLLGVSRALGSHPGLVGHGMSTGTVSMATYLVERTLPELRVGPAPAPGATPATPEQVRALILDLLDETAQHRSFLQGLRDERVMELDTAMVVADGKLKLRDVIGSYGAGSVIPLALEPMILEDARILVEHTTAVLKAAEKSPDYPTFLANAPKSPLPPATGPGGGGHVMARLLLPSFDTATRTRYRCLAERRMAAAALAVKWYQAEHDDRPPRTLDELVPKYLPAVPSDPFGAGGQPLRYVSDPDRLAVYSIGENGTDNDGSEMPLNARRKSPNRWEQQDAVLRITPKPAGE
jgi:hypothetical protein